LEFLPVQVENDNDGAEKENNTEEQEWVIVKFLGDRFARGTGVGGGFDGGKEHRREDAEKNRRHGAPTWPTIPPFGVTGPRHMPYLTDSPPKGRDSKLNRNEMNMAQTLAECHAPDRNRLPGEVKTVHLFIICTNYCLSDKK
jgi:hypothetical protein